MLGLGLASLMVASTVSAGQDRLFVGVGGMAPPASGVVEVGAVDRFGRRLGSAPADVLTALRRVIPFAVTATALVSTETGAVVWTAPAGETIDVLVEPVATADRTRAYLQTVSGGFFDRVVRLRAIDVASGVGMAETPGYFDVVHWDPVGRRVFAFIWSGGQWQVFDENLVPLGAFSLGASHCRQTLLISEHSERAYLAYTAEGSGGSYGPSDTRLAAIDLRHSRLIDLVSLVQVLGLSDRAVCPPVLALWSVPGAPAGLSATATGRDVTLSWFATDLAAGYGVDVGVAAGLTSATVVVGDTTRVTFVGAPPGTYFVRLRAGNVVGASRPSGEIRVVVP